MRQFFLTFWLELFKFIRLVTSCNLFVVDPDALGPIDFTFEWPLQVLLYIVHFSLVVKVPFKENFVAEPCLNVLIHRVHCFDCFFACSTFLDRLPYSSCYLKLNWLDLLQLGVPVLVIWVIRLILMFVLVVTLERYWIHRMHCDGNRFLLI